MDQLQPLINNWILLAQGLIGSIGTLALASGELPRTVTAPYPFPGSLRARAAAPTVRDVIQELEADGWRMTAQRGSHRQLEHPIKPRTVTVPGALGAELARRALSNIRRRAGIKGPKR